LLGRTACQHRVPGGQAWFGDLHVHTALSMDASAAGVTATPDDAYRFALGETIALPGGRPTRIDRPLDFAAVTDHAEWMAEVAFCGDPGSAAYASRSCRIFRGEVRSTWASLHGWRGMEARLVGIAGWFGGRSTAICGRDGGRCRDQLRAAWVETLAAAERWYDRSSACRFTTFAGFEFTRTPDRTNLHRNVIFRNERTPELPISSVETPDAHALRQRLMTLCNDTGTGCEALVIPHNANLSNGRMFALRSEPIAEEEWRERAALRARLEPVVEMMQIKGESECANGFDSVLGEPDELRDFEKIRAIREGALEDCGAGVGSGAQAAEGRSSRHDYVRYALLAGTLERRRSGINPLAFGFVGSTDDHYARAGGTSERTMRMRPYSWNPGGLAGVWAEENSRDAIFDAILRRETFATSGPRITPRFFGGWDLPADLCERGDFVAIGAARGVAMGGELDAGQARGRVPVFAVSALRDPGQKGAPGGLLQRLQVIKGWVDEAGRYHQEVHDVAGDPHNGASVDLATCATRGPGADHLCAVWADEAYEAGREAVYYARVVENPSCRWSTRACNARPPHRRPAFCDAGNVPKTIQERAWTSPIWVVP